MCNHNQCVTIINVLSKNKKKYLIFYSREILQYIVWACLRNVCRELPALQILGTFY